MRDRYESDLAFIEIMIDRFSRIEENINRFNRLGLDMTDEMVLDNLAFQLAQAGEQLSQNKLSEELREKFSHIDWQRMKNNRNFMVHSYNRKVNNVLINIVKMDVPKYIEQLYEVRKYLLNELEE